jgi:iron complex outermembrane receptor protein
MNGMGNETNRPLLRILLLALLLAFTANHAWAQDAEETDEDDATEQSEPAEDEEPAELDSVVVTGSRLQRETYTSISPLQIITAEGSREAGLINAADILQQSTAAGGLQIDLTFSGFVLDNGPGSSTINLRGMGEARTLVLLNGRRLAPAGVEGAPFAADLNLVPSMLVRQYEVLLDGASSVYGSDAVAGVTNIIMRKDFDGLELDVFYNHPDQPNGESYTLTGSWGKNYDRGFFGVGVEYQNNDAVRWGDRSWTSPCDKHHEIDENGQIRSQDVYYSTQFGMEWDECRFGSVYSRVVVPFQGSIYYTPGYTNGGWPNFSESSISNWFGIDGDGDGQTDISFRDYDGNGKPYWQNTHLFPETERISLMAYGEHTFEGDMNNTAYFEANYNERDFFQYSYTPGFFPYVPANNPYNLCNPAAPGGVDCGLAQDALWTNPNVISSFQNYWGGFCDSIGVPIEFCTPESFGFLVGEIGAADTIPIVAPRGDRSTNDVNVKQYRVVFGFKGDLPFVDWGSMSSWVYDLGVSYSTSDGKSAIPGIREDRFDMAAGWYSSSNTPCENDLGYSMNPDTFGQGTFSDTAAGCVPVNMFAPSLYPFGDDVEGDFATQAERDYLFGIRSFDTEYTQTLFSGYANGFLFEMQGGTAMGGLGFEWREDEIQSIPNEIASEGLLVFAFADRGASGKKWTRELFGEIELPILGGLPAAEELRVNLSARWTDDEFYGSDTTYAAKLGWRPINSLLFRGTLGTSFRAPNVREVFLDSQTGFVGVSDPCVVPEAARDPLTGEYVPGADPRDQIVLENCALNGVDPTALDNNGITSYSVEIGRGGTPGLEAETSTSWTAGFSFEQPWVDAFDLVFGMTYYQTEIEDTIIEPSGTYLVNQCYLDPQLDSALCDKITRDADGFLDFIDARFVNRDEEMYRGIDINANYDQNFNIGATGVRVGVDLIVHRQLEASETFIDDTGNLDFEDYYGTRWFPKWKGQLGLRVNVSDFRWTWVVNYRGKNSQLDEEQDEFSDAFSEGEGTCYGPPDDVLCRDYGDMDDYWLHSTSLYWYGDAFTIGAGIRNVFDEEPPRVDSNEIWNSYNRTPIGLGYDLMGRTYFLNFIWKM